MTKPFSSKVGPALKFSSWPTALIAIVVIKAVLSLAVKPGSFLVSYSGISYFLLLFLATGLAIRNGIQNTLDRRPFWVLLAIACGLWSLDQGLSLYYECFLHIEVPDNSIADPVLFLHIVPLMAAVATFSHRNVFDRRPYQAILNSFLLLFFWTFLYGYIVLSSPLAETSMRLNPYPGHPPCLKPSRASRLKPARTLTPSSRLYSPAIVLFRAFISMFGSAPSLMNVSAQ
jgi:hypothetical protein